jgi:hypothetical protein
MSESADRTGDEQFVNAAAIVSLVLGSVLLIAPATARRVLGVDSDRRVLRTIGAVDLALAPGLYFGRTKWPWLVARAASNPLIAAVAVANARTLRARVIAAGLVGATLIDVGTAARLRASVSDDAGRSRRTARGPASRHAHHAMTLLGERVKSDGQREHAKFRRRIETVCHESGDEAHTERAVPRGRSFLAQLPDRGGLVGLVGFDSAAG